MKRTSKLSLKNSLFFPLIAFLKASLSGGTSPPTTSCWRLATCSSLRTATCSSLRPAMCSSLRPATFSSLHPASWIFLRPLTRIFLRPASRLFLRLLTRIFLSPAARIFLGPTTRIFSIVTTQSSAHLWSSSRPHSRMTMLTTLTRKIMPKTRTISTMRRIFMRRKKRRRRRKYLPTAPSSFPTVPLNLAQNSRMSPLFWSMATHFVTDATSLRRKTSSLGTGKQNLFVEF